MHNNIWVEIGTEEIQEKVRGYLSNPKFRLLSTITGYQEGDKIYIIYHLIYSEGAVNLRANVPLSNPVMPSISKILPGATLYEREIQDLLGVKFEGLTDPRRLILPEQWKEGVYPLRKDFKVSGEEK